MGVSSCCAVTVFLSYESYMFKKKGRGNCILYLVFGKFK